MRNASVTVQGINKSYDVSKNLGLFKIMLPQGEYKVEISCHGYQNQLIDFEVTEGTITHKKIVLQRTNEQTYEGYIEAHEPISMEGAVKNAITGYVRDDSHHSIANAEIFVQELNITTHTNQEGKYMVPLKPGKYTIKVTASGYESHVKYVDVNSANVYPKLVMFTMRRDKHFWGLPRMAFVIIFGTLGVGIVAACVLCVMYCRRDGKEYGLLSQNEDILKGYDHSDFLGKNKTLTGEQNSQHSSNLWHDHFFS